MYTVHIYLTFTVLYSVTYPTASETKKKSKHQFLRIYNTFSDLDPASAESNNETVPPPPPLQKADI